MPMYDYRCSECGHEFEQLRNWQGSGVTECPECHAPAPRVWINKPPLAIGDECDIIQENGFAFPQRFTSKETREKALRDAGLEEKVTHVPVPGSDKSPHTTSWSAVSKETLDGAAAMLERVGKGGKDAEPEDEGYVEWGNRAIGLKISRMYSGVINVPKDNT